VDHWGEKTLRTGDRMVPPYGRIYRAP
jgi:hypothetical protein